MRPQHQPHKVLLRLIALQHCFPLPHSLHILGLLLSHGACLWQHSSFVCHMSVCVKSMLRKCIISLTWAALTCVVLPSAADKSSGIQDFAAVLGSIT